MAARGWIALTVLALACAGGVVANGGVAGAARFNPNASTSSTSTKVKVAHQGPRGSASYVGSGRRAKREAAPSIGAFIGPDLTPPPAPLTPVPPVVTQPSFAESLIGLDTRSEVFDTVPNPSRMVAMITNNGSQWCTGFLIGPDTLITAGHCVHPGGSGSTWYPPTAMRVYPAYNPLSANTDAVRQLRRHQHDGPGGMDRPPPTTSTTTPP